jgi:drug/metabolite transporter (DMT)-like permease
MIAEALPGRANRTGLGAIYTIAAMFGFASMDAMSKLLVQDYAITQVLWIRYAFYTLFALAVTRRHGGWRVVLRSRRPWLQAGRGVLAVIEAAVFVAAFYFLPLADTHAVAATSPLIVIALAVVMLGERAGLRRWLAVGAGFAGVLLIIRPGFQTLEWPLLLPLVGALLWGLYQILVRLCAQVDRPETTLLWSALAGLGATTLVGPWQWQTPDLYAWTLLIGIAALGSLSHFALIKALDYAEAGAVQPYSYMLLVWAAVLGFVVFGDIPDVWTVAGAIIVVMSGLYTWHHDRREAARMRKPGA